MQRCAFCRKPSCAYCIEERLCPTCREEGRVAPERTAKAPRKGPLTDEDRANRQRLMKLGGVLVVALAANYWWFFGGFQSAEEANKERLNLAQGITMEYLIHHREPPKSLNEIRVVAKTLGKELPLMVPADCRPIPNTVAYSYNGKQYTFKGYDKDGKPVMADGKVMVLTAP
jgi:hypothetical protein